MLSRLGYVLAALVVVGLALACLVWVYLEPPAVPVPHRDGVRVIKDVTLVNPGLGRSSHVDITIRDGVIARIEATRPNATRDDIRCGGCYALPGLIDMGARIERTRLGDDRRAALLYLDRGVTSVREIGPAAASEPLRLGIEAGRFPGPRILPCQPRAGVCGALDLPPPPADDAGVAELVQGSLLRQAAYAPRLTSSAGPDLRRDSLVRAFFRAGVPVYAGGGDAASMLRELKAIAALGTSAEGALVTATTSPGRFWPETTYGQIAIGLPADIVLYRADPTRDLDALAAPQTVIADGRVYAGARLRAWAERYRRQARALGR